MPLSKCVSYHLIDCKLSFLESLEFRHFIEVGIFAKNRLFIDFAKNFFYLGFSSQELSLCARVSSLNHLFELFSDLKLLLEFVIIFNSTNLFSSCQIHEIRLSDNTWINSLVVL